MFYAVKNCRSILAENVGAVLQGITASDTVVVVVVVGVVGVGVGVGVGVVTVVGGDVVVVVLA